LIKNINQKLYYYLFPFLLGGVTSFSLPPYNFLYINFFTFPALLFILIKIQKKPNSIWLNFKIGWLFGIGYFLSNVYWIVYALTFEDIFKPFIPFALIFSPISTHGSARVKLSAPPRTIQILVSFIG